MTTATLARPTVYRLIERAAATTGRVDRANGVIRGVRVLGRHSSNGREYTLDALREAAPMYNGCPVYLDHSKSERESRRVKDLLGRLENVRLVGEALVGDLHYSKSHPYADTIADAAESGMEGVGLSHNVEATVGKSRYDGREMVDGIKRVVSCDIVIRPATNRNFFESSSREQASRRFCENVAPPALDLPGSDLRMLILTALGDGNDDAETLRRIRALVETPNPIAQAAKEARRPQCRVTVTPRLPSRSARPLLEALRPTPLKKYPESRAGFLSAMKY